MNESAFDIDQLKDYLHGKLTPDESAAFEKRMEQDKAFRKEVNIHKAILAGMDQHFDKRLKDVLIREERTARGASGRNSGIKWVTIAASLALAISVAFLLFLNRRTNHQEIFGQYYRPYQNVISETERGEQDTLASYYREAFREYEAQHYQEAVEAFNQLRTQDTQDSAITFYLGLSLLATGNTNEAVRLLQKVATEDHPLSEPAYWYLGLAHVKADNIIAAKEVFDQIKTSRSSYATRAEKILEDLD